MSRTLTAHTARPSAVTLFDRHPFGRVFLVFKAQLFEQSSGGVKPRQLAFCPHDSWSKNGTLKNVAKTSHIMFRRRRRHCEPKFIYVLMSSFLVGFAAAGRFRAADCSRWSGNGDGRGGRHWRNRSSVRSCNVFFGTALKEMGKLRDFGSDNTLGRGRLLSVFTVRVLTKRSALKSMKRNHSRTLITIEPKSNYTHFTHNPPIVVVPPKQTKNNNCIERMWNSKDYGNVR